MDPVQIAARYGLPWGIASGLAIAIAYLYRTTVPRDVWETECQKNDKMADTVSSLTGDVRTLLALQQRRGADS